jgi:hypothetical protein
MPTLTLSLSLPRWHLLVTLISNFDLRLCVIMHVPRIGHTLTGNAVGDGNDWVYSVGGANTCS